MHRRETQRRVIMAKLGKFFVCALKPARRALRAFTRSQGIQSSVTMDNKFFFDRYGMTSADIERYLSAALSAGGDFADLYFEYQTSTSVSLDESMVKSATQGISVGCGVRVLCSSRAGSAPRPAAIRFQRPGQVPGSGLSTLVGAPGATRT